MRNCKDAALRAATGETRALKIHQPTVDLQGKLAIRDRKTGIGPAENSWLGIFFVERAEGRELGEYRTIPDAACGGDPRLLICIFRDKWRRGGLLNNLM